MRDTRPPFHNNNEYQQDQHDHAHSLKTQLEQDSWSTTYIVGRPTKLQGWKDKEGYVEIVALIRSTERGNRCFGGKRTIQKKMAPSVPMCHQRVQGPLWLEKHRQAISP